MNIKKNFILLIGILFSINAYSTQYCYDDAVFELDTFKSKILECSDKLNTKPIDRLSNALERVAPFYSLKIRNLTSKLYEYVHTDLRYKYADSMSEEVKSCLSKLEYDEFDKVKISIMDAMVLCGI